MQTSYWNGQYKDFLCTWLVIICKKNCDHNSVRSKGLGYIDEKFDSYRKVYEFNRLPHKKNEIKRIKTTWNDQKKYEIWFSIASAF